MGYGFKQSGFACTVLSGKKGYRREEFETSRFMKNIEAKGISVPDRILLR